MEIHDWDYEKSEYPSTGILIVTRNGKHAALRNPDNTRQLLAEHTYLKKKVEIYEKALKSLSYEFDAGEALEEAKKLDE